MNPTDFQQSLVSTSSNSLRQNNTHVNNVISAQQTSPYIYQSPVQTTPSTYSGQGNTNYNIASTHQNVSCKIVSPSFLNKNFYGTETGQNISQEKLAFTLYQKEILKQDLALYLSYHLLD
ncbi:hypothetical protein RhiirA4_462203 [Rhizophagus irregularis]|uniref:Uncharacterized protein n=1 Tax=Rhizophagus irregularis TaxID=588596 RepID=A0A2I1GKF1_9GLOM|nr:hypothetical protein RhiirA4_462203 [Rhizophagus irregularis]